MTDDRSYHCPKCGGWMVGREDGDTWSCDTCGYVTGEGADDKEFGDASGNEEN